MGVANRSPLAGLIFDESGKRLTPTHTGQKCRRHRYYVSQVEQDGMSTAKPVMRIPAQEIETFLQKQLTAWFAKPLEVACALYGDQCDPDVKQKVASASIRLGNRLDAESRGSELLSTLKRVVIGDDFIEFVLDAKDVSVCLGKFEDLGACKDRPAIVIKTLMRIQKSGRPNKLLISAFNLSGQLEPRINESMVRLLGRAQKWDRDVRSGKSITAIAKGEKVHRTYVGQVLPLAYLAPDIVDAIIDGRQPPELKVEYLLKPLSIDWREQRQALGFAAA